MGMKRTSWNSLVCGLSQRATDVGPSFRTIDPKAHLAVMFVTH